MGDRVGKSVGVVVGTSVAALVGTSVGVVVGTSVGVVDGISVGVVLVDAVGKVVSSKSSGAPVVVDALSTAELGSLFVRSSDRCCCEPEFETISSSVSVVLLWTPQGILQARITSTSVASRSWKQDSRRNFRVAAISLLFLRHLSRMPKNLTGTPSYDEETDGKQLSLQISHNSTMLAVSPSMFCMVYVPTIS